MKPKFIQHTDMATFGETLFRHKNLVIPKLGRFELRVVKPRKMYHNFTDKIITTKKGYKVHFIPYGKLKKLCKQ